MKETRELPFILAGVEYSPESDGSGLVLDYDDGQIRIQFPEYTINQLKKHIEAVENLVELSTENILDFLSAVGELWKDPEYPRYKEALELMRRITDFSEEELILDFSYIPSLLEKGGYLEEMLQSEYGNSDILDRWITRGGCEVRAVPRGRVLHVLAGNVPGVEIISLARGLMTKNANILKMARGNPVTPISLVQSFADVDPDHPITRSTSVLYWERGSEIEKDLYRNVQTACVWGGFDAVQAAWKHARPGLEILDYGPKRSMAFIGSSTMESETQMIAAAVGLAADTVVHDQQACHSPQVVFVDGNAKTFAKALGSALDEAGKAIPRGSDSIDRQAQLGHMRNMAELLGEEVFHPGSTAWTLIVTRDFSRTPSNPLGRTLWIIPVNGLGEAIARVDRYTMVFGFSDRTDLETCRDQLAVLGVDRLTILGRMGLLPAGTPHEGRYDLTRLVKFVSADLTPEYCA